MMQIHVGALDELLERAVAPIGFSARIGVRSPPASQVTCIPDILDCYMTNRG